MEKVDPGANGKLNPEQEKEYEEIRKELIEIDRKDYFTVDVSELSENEIKVNKKIDEWRQSMSNKDNMPYLKDYYDGKDEVLNSDLYKALFTMPKGAHHHCHSTAAAPIDLLMELTKEDIVYYSMKENKIKIFTHGHPDDGYVQCNMMRDNWTKEGTFDEFLRSKILLTKEDTKSKYSTEIWNNFQYKFSLTLELYCYHKFFKRIITEVLKISASEKVFILEFRHILGGLLDDLGKPLPVDEEIKIFEECEQEVPEVKMKIIVCGLKLFGESHIQEQLHYCVDQFKKTDFIAGFDMVNEEDTTAPIKSFRSIINESLEKHDNIHVIFHAGESTLRDNENLYDAILMGTRRIGHGLAVINHPHLVEEIKRKGICIELCPISNLILAYTLDLRWHPGKFLLQKGVPVSLSADDPGFWEIQGLTLDYCYATLAWELDIKDLKQFAINGIKYCSLTEEEKEVHMKKFYIDWEEWIESVLK